MKEFIRISVLIFIALTLISINMYAQWQQLNGPTGADIRCLTIKGDSIFAGTYGKGVFLSTNNGDSWNAINNGLTRLFINDLLINGSDIYAGSDSDGVFLSTDFGMNWYQVNNGLSNRYVTALAASGNNIFAGIIGSGVFVSMNKGTSWTALNVGLTNLNVWALVASGSKLYAGMYGFGVYYSNNYGTSWTKSGLDGEEVRSLMINGTDVFAGTWGEGVYRISNIGGGWKQINTSLTNREVMSFAAKGINIFAGTKNGVFMSKNNGESWTNINQGFTTYPTVSSLLLTDDYIIAGTVANTIWRRSLSDFFTSIPGNTEQNATTIMQNYPNPFSASTTISYSITNNGLVKLEIFDKLGRLVETLVNEEQAAGTYEVKWSGSDQSAGLFILKLFSTGNCSTKTIMLLK